jgi:hypothetical protein
LLAAGMAVAMVAGTVDFMEVDSMEAVSMAAAVISGEASAVRGSMPDHLLATAPNGSVGRVGAGHVACTFAGKKYTECDLIDWPAGSPAGLIVRLVIQ